MPLCSICHAPLAAPRRKYCGHICTKEAIRRWKRDVRERTRKLWLAGLSADPPWMDGWKTPDARRAYYRKYMQRRRRAQRDRSNPAEIRLTPHATAHASSPLEPHTSVTESVICASW